MGFGGRASGRADGGDVGEAVDAMERAAAGLTRIRHRLEAAGAPLAATYVEGARDALSFAVEAALWDGGIGMGDGMRIGTAKLRLERDGDGCYGRLAADAPVSLPPAEARRSLGADLSSDAELVACLRSDEVAAGLMASALAHSDWLHLSSHDVFFGDHLAARAVVATIAGRSSFPCWTRRQMGGLVDRASASALAKLGWRRMTGSSLPVGGMRA